MGSFVEDLARGNVTEVKVILASVALALAVYQAVLIAVAYRRLRPGFLAADAASFAHRATGGTIVVVTARSSAAERELREDLLELREDLLEERMERREERLEERGAR